MGRSSTIFSKLSKRYLQQINSFKSFIDLSMQQQQKGFEWIYGSRKIVIEQLTSLSEGIINKKIYLLLFKLKTYTN